MIDPIKLRYLYHASLYGGIRHAAEELQVSPSTVSRQIALLEEELKLTLLERDGRNVRTTEVGRALCEYYRAQQSAEIQLRDKLDEYRHVKRGRIRLSIGEGFAEWIINHPLRAFQAQYPSIELDINIQPTHDSVQAILDDEADIAITYFAPNDRNLKFHARSEVPICVVVHEDHPLTKLGKNPQLTDVFQCPLGLLHESFGGRQITDFIARSENIELRPVLTANSYNVIRFFVSLGKGVFIMPYRPSPQRELKNNLQALILDYATVVTSQTQVITRADRHLTIATRTLLNMLIDTGEFEIINN